MDAKEKRRLARAVGKAKRDGRIPRTAQQTIPYKEMCRDGICIAGDNFYTKQVEFLDINYQLARNEDKNAIFENWCDFLNYFDSSIRFQFSFLNQRMDLEGLRGNLDIPGQGDGFDGIRKEYAGMLHSQLQRGNNGLSRTKYITFGVEADSLKAAKARLERIEADVLANFKVLGVKARALDGYERLSILHGMLHPAGSGASSLPGTPSGRRGFPQKTSLPRTALLSRTAGISGSARPSAGLPSYSCLRRN